MGFDLAFLVKHHIFDGSRICGQEDLDARTTAKVVIQLLKVLQNPQYQKDPLRFGNERLSKRDSFTIDIIKDSVNKALFDHKDLFQKKMKQMITCS